MKDLLLLLCFYPYDERNRKYLLKLIGEITDWDNLIRLINAHGIIALATYNIKEAKLEHSVPAESMRILENGYLQSIVRNTWLTKCWKEVNTILSDAGIKHVLLKGMALEHTLYESKGLRQMTDNDILLKKEDALKAWYILQQHGFRHELLKSPLHKKIMLDIGKHLPCLYKNGYALEIHHNIFVKNFIDDAFTDTIEITIDNTQAFILSEKNQLRHLVNHFYCHAEGGSVQFRQYADILLSDKGTKVVMPEQFITNPQQGEKIKYRKAAYKINIMSIPARSRIRYLLGDIFPSVKWMKKRHKCNALKALWHYPMRIGKLLWLV